MNMVFEIRQEGTEIWSGAVEGVNEPSHKLAFVDKNGRLQTTDYFNTHFPFVKPDSFWAGWSKVLVPLMESLKDGRFEFPDVEVKNLPAN